MCVYICTEVHTYSKYVCVYDMCGACLTLLRGHEQSEVTGVNRMTVQYLVVVVVVQLGNISFGRVCQLVHHPKTGVAV